MYSVSINKCWLLSILAFSAVAAAKDHGQRPGDEDALDESAMSELRLQFCRPEIIAKAYYSIVRFQGHCDLPNNGFNPAQLRASSSTPPREEFVDNDKDNDYSNYHERLGLKSEQKYFDSGFFPYVTPYRAGRSPNWLKYSVQFNPNRKQVQSLSIWVNNRATKKNHWISFTKGEIEKSSKGFSLYLPHVFVGRQSLCDDAVLSAAQSLLDTAVLLSPDDRQALIPANKELSSPQVLNPRVRGVSERPAGF